MQAKLLKVKVAEKQKLHVLDGASSRHHVITIVKDLATSQTKTELETEKPWSTGRPCDHDDHYFDDTARYERRFDRVLLKPYHQPQGV